ncbi:MAG TPA: hypothetical protein VFH02_01720 [Jiangellaceae bacterium]|nr:hypothetical protein [Jiangellaceae bacterium]
MRFDQHTLVPLVTPADALDLPDDEAEAVQDAHLASQADLYDKGLHLAAGPFDGQDDERCGASRSSASAG